MKKFLTLCATFVFIGALFVGCIDNTEPASVGLLRTTKVKLIEAQIELLNSQAELNRAYAVFALAEAERERQIAAIREQEAAYLKIQNEFERAILAARIADEIAFLKYCEATHLADMWLAMEDARAYEEAYLTGLIEQRARLWGAKIDALDDIFWAIYDLILERAEVRNDILIWTARKVFYETVEMPYVEAQLRHSLEISNIKLSHSKAMLDMWTVIKNLAVNEYLDYAALMYPEMQAVKEREVEILGQIAVEEFEYEKLKTIEEQAKYAYFNSGVNTSETNVLIPFNTTPVTDLFAEYNLANGHKPGGVGGPTPDEVISGVYDGDYSFYNVVGRTTNDNYPAGTKASLSYKQTLDILKADYNLIKDGRIYGVEGQAMVDITLAARKKAYDDAYKQYTDANAAWNTNYPNIHDKSNWTAARTTFNNALAAYRNTWGVLVDYYITPDPADWPQDADKAEALKAVATGMEFLAAMMQLDPNARNEALAALPVNYLYWLQKTAIEQYVSIVKGLIRGTYTQDQLNLAQVSISDVLGGITFSPLGLLELVLGQGNAAAFKLIVDYLYGIAELIDIVAAIQIIMPAYYQATHNFAGGLYKEPIFEKYNVSQAWEYHAWFLIYILFENMPVAPGNSIFKINSYDFAEQQLALDFLAYNTPNYPGGYEYLSNPAVASSILASHRGLATPGLNTVLGFENDLRNAWRNWAGAFRTLSTNENNLYGEWARVWTVEGHMGYGGNRTTQHAALATNPNAAGVPAWVYENPAATNMVVVATPKNADFYFMHELALDTNYPSLVDGEHIYWANLSSSTDPANVGWAQRLYYPAIAVKHSRLVSVDWNRWVNQGRPHYFNDPILWWSGELNASFPGGNSPTTWENNTVLPAAYVPKAFVTYRNYQQFLFWQLPETQDAYKALAEEIKLKIDDLQVIVDELYQEWVDATAARIIKEYEIEAFRYEAGLLNGRYLAMYQVYSDLLCENVVVDIYREYDNWFHLYNNDLQQYNFDLANLDTFMNDQSRYIYAGGGPTPEFDDFVADLRKEIDGHIEALNLRLTYIEAELLLLQGEYTKVINIVL